ncbi:MAG: nickel-type superoxide dismutase maturation protease [Candidatus Aenigmarchaeota archaeon]|nr:nickel-type superoxide dismutase maturation protease [Candidatus Aenigmarchaeota archaeon]
MFPITRFKIEDKSMEPEFRPGDYVLVNRLIYFLRNPSKGEVVVLKHPKEKNRFIIKRISLITNSHECYVVGDNKDFSQDSRHFGPVKKNSIIGKVWIHLKR